MSDTSRTVPTPAAAVEVVATFGDTVVGVEHRADPRGGRTSLATRAMLAFGAVALTGAAAGFAYAAHVAADDYARKEALIAQGKPEWAFRPHLLPRSADVAFVLGGGLGLTALLLGLARRRDERRSPRVRIGTGGGVDLAAPAAPASEFELVGPAPGGDGFVLNLAGALAADVGGSPVAHAAVPVTDGLRARVRCGEVTFHVAGVAAPVRQPTPILAAIDRRAASYLAGSVAAHAAILLLLRTIGPDADTIGADTSADENIDIRAMAHAMETPPPTPAPGTTGDDDGGAGTPNPQQTAMALAQPGKVGAPGASSEHPARARASGDERAEAIEQARRAGVLDLWNGDRVAELTGSDDLTRGFDDADINGIFDGDSDGDGVPDGTFGHGRHGVGRGGDLVVAGDYHTIPGGRPGGEGFNLGPTGGHCATGHVCKGHEPVPPPVHIGPPTGDPDITGVVQRYIKRNKDRIGYCYEKALLGHPDLEGTVTEVFLLDASGHVLSSTATGVGAEVDSCVQDVVAGIEFPRLADSGTFKITYPFVMHAPAH